MHTLCPFPAYFLPFIPLSPSIDQYPKTTPVSILSSSSSSLHVRHARPARAPRSILFVPHASACHARLLLGNNTRHTQKKRQGKEGMSVRESVR